MKFIGGQISYTRSIKEILIGLPNPSNPVQSTIESITQFEQLTIKFRAIRFGFKQDGSRINSLLPVDYFNSFLQLNIVICVLRGIFLSLIDSPTYRLLLGDPLFGSDQLPFAPIFILVCVIGSDCARLTFRFYENNGQLKLLDDINRARIDHFASFKDELTPKSFDTLITVLHLITTFFSRFIMSAVAILTFLINAPLLVNPYYFTQTDFTIAATCWSFNLSFVFIFLFNSVVSIGGYYVLLLILFVLRFKSLIERISFGSNGFQVKIFSPSRQLAHSDDEISLMINRMTSLLNTMDSTSTELRYFTLYILSMVAILGDLDIFFGAISPVHSKLIAVTLATIGFQVLTLLGATCFFAANPTIDMQKLNRHFHSNLFYRKNSPLGQSLKIHEIFTRLNGSSNGFKVGDLCSIDRKLFVIILLENASMLMLFTCNVKSFMSTQNQ